MRLVEQWGRIEEGLPERWAAAQLSLDVADEAEAARAAAGLGPLNPGREGTRVRFAASRAGEGFGPEHVRRLLRRLDRRGVAGTLELVSAAEADAPAGPRGSLAADWDAALATLPEDWSDLLCEVELRSSGQLDRAALLLSRLNPARDGERAALRFRVARRFGYGASPGNARRGLERLDTEGVAGRVAILRALSESQPVATQGPVWYLGGRAV